MLTYKDNPVYFEERADILKVLSHPVRLCIVKGLMENGESNVMSMQNCLSIPQSTISQHLSALRNKGIIRGRREGLEVFYSVQNPLVKKLIHLMFFEQY
ncbi:MULTISPECIES: metalloregulator ArsR/SmtB family transcription factor [unclassified Dehalobacter]|uniref:ArsR/SmtB family transcription factor n=1 Tax=unclassified Dehalobacter TaxID=2635733 RepID=UPI0003708C96|nr:MULTISPECIES: metalloregulator ArsR/SmtB family transcription factor [unclassified Dehalobacter]RJE48833.1 transcriptional regulator [Dehalobacter sp. MCB1]TCX51995.1 transcriptional regulator [Dehalobacter sp. 14DCB1]TCX53069.1 transcriptional regulator [Dehalobacter sp. 12DCB1]